MAQTSYHVKIKHKRTPNEGGSTRDYLIQAPSPELAVQIAMGRCKDDNRNSTVFDLVSVK